MAQELISKTVAIIGAGPAGCCCAYFLNKKNCAVTLFEKKSFLSTILPTGGGRCNFANAIYDFKELASNYPRGEKFLYSVFSKFSTQDTVDMFNNIGVKSYTQTDNRIFPMSNSSKEIRDKFLNSLKCEFVKEEVVSIEKSDTGYKIQTTDAQYLFDIIVFAIGGHSDYKIISDLGIKIIEPVQSLVGFITKEDFSTLSGVSLKNIFVKYDKKVVNGDILFTHKGISGPAIYTVSSLKARDKLPYKLSIDFIKEFDLQYYLDRNPHKEIKNLLSEFVPKSLGVWILNNLGINPELKCHKINKIIRDKIVSNLHNFEVNVVSKIQDGEIVTCGGVDLAEINPKTMESKKYKNIYFCGEVVDIDGFCGGFNLQNCWSGAFVVSESIQNL